MEQPHEPLNDAPWTQVGDATLAWAAASHSQPAAEQYLIKHKCSQEYFSYGHWTFDPAEAQAFRSARIALSVAQQCGLRNVALEQRPAAA